MAITGVFLGGTVAVNPATGVTTLGASVELIDSELGPVGQRDIPATDPVVIAAVTSFLVQTLPQLSLDAGFPITLPSV